MISRICGKLKEKREDSLLVDVNGICYKVLVPQVVMRAIEETKNEDGTISLVTFHYLQTDPAKSIPTLIGFLNEIEKEFFECFITVSGVGPKAALRALNLPISTIAAAIDSGNVALLQSLPGIGTQRAKEIIAKLQGKVGKFGLIQDDKVSKSAPVKEDIQNEALEVLLQLQYKKSEAKQMIQEAILRNPAVKTAEDILNEVYKQKTVKCKR